MDKLRFSAFLRKNTRLEIDRGRCRININRQPNIDPQMASKFERDFSWKMIKKFFVEKNSKNKSEIRIMLIQLWISVKHLTDNLLIPKNIERLTIFFLEYFLDKTYITDRNLREIKNEIETITLRQANDILTTVNNIQQLSNVSLEEFLNFTVDTKPNFWGDNIICKLPIDRPKCPINLYDFSVEPHSTSKSLQEFSMKYNANQKYITKFSREWLEQYLHGESIDYCLQLLYSRRLNIELQNDLLNLFGIDKVHIIHDICSNRQKIIENNHVQVFRGGKPKREFKRI